MKLFGQRFDRRIVAAIAVVSAMCCGVAQAAEAWRNIPAEGAPGCALGAPYSFWAKKGDPTKLVVLLGGGGACWSGENCTVRGKTFYRSTAGVEQDPSTYGGVFDGDNAENPFATYTIIYLPTCNGDSFLGDSVTTYDLPAADGQPAGKVRVLHKGYANATSALQWVFKTYQRPKAVAVVGWSAGALASPLYTHIVATHYPDAKVSQFGDGGGGYRVGRRLQPLLKSWGTANVLQSVKGFESLDIDTLTYEDLYIRAAQLHPDIVFHQYNTKNDEIQGLFMRLLGVEHPDVAANIEEAHAYINSKAPNFRSFTSWGHDENIVGGYYDGVLARNALENRGRPYALDRLYTYKTNGIRFLDWFAAAVTGQPVENVTCQDCKTPEYQWKRPSSPQ